MTMGTPPPGGATRRVGGAGVRLHDGSKGRYRYHGIARVRLWRVFGLHVAEIGARERRVTCARGCGWWRCRDLAVAA